MIALHINKIKHQVPTSWADVSFQTYIDMLVCAFRNADEFEIVSARTGIDVEILKQTDYLGFLKIVELTEFMSGSLEAFAVVPDDMKIDIATQPYEKYYICKQAIKAEWTKLFGDKAQLEPAEATIVYLSAAPVFCKQYLEIEIQDKPIPAVYGIAVFFCNLFKSSTLVMSN